MKPQVFIIINPYSHQGKGWRRWQQVRSTVVQQLGAATELVSEKGFSLKSIIPLISGQPETILVSAGGDGTMNHLCNFLLEEAAAFIPGISIGAVGLGSSNDFLKPFRQTIHNIPVRINLSEPAQWRDLGLVHYTDEQGQSRQKYFAINASFGATAMGNWKFNHPGRILKWLKKTNTSLAINYTSLATILGFRNINCTVSYDDRRQTVSVSNINLLKIPFIAGSLRYNQAIEPDDEKFGLNICKDMSKFELIKTLLDLSKGRFVENKKKSSGYVNAFELRSGKPVIFECDGETEKSSFIRVKLVPRALRFLH